MSIVYKELQSGLDFRLADSTIFAKKRQAYYIEFDIYKGCFSQFGYCNMG